MVIYQGAQGGAYLVESLSEEETRHLTCQGGAYLAESLSEEEPWRLAMGGDLRASGRPLWFADGGDAVFFADAALASDPLQTKIVEESAVTAS